MEQIELQESWGALVERLQPVPRCDFTELRMDSCGHCRGIDLADFEEPRKAWIAE